MTSMSKQSNIEATAIMAGLISFVAVYALGGIIIIFILSLMSEMFDSDRLMSWLRIFGYLALAFPAYVAASAVNHHAILHALVMGVIEGLAIVALMMFTFSWEGTLHSYVLSRMLPVFGAVVALCLFAGVFAEWLKIRRYRQDT